MGDGVASIIQFILFMIHLVEFIKDVDSDTSKSYLKRVIFLAPSHCALKIKSRVRLVLALGYCKSGGDVGTLSTINKACHVLISTTSFPLYLLWICLPHLGARGPKT
jgi:hypothetical protein